MDIPVATIISAAATVVVAIITGVISYKIAKLNKKINEEKEESDKRAKQRKDEALLQMQMTQANSQLTIGIAMALKHGKCNGEVEAGLAAVNKANDDYNSFLKKIALEDLH